MNIINHPICNRLIGAPADMTDDQCSALPVYDVEDEHGRWSISFWMPSVGELEILKAGGSVALWVRASGRQHPVVGMAAEEPVGATLAEKIALAAKLQAINEKEARNANR